MTDHPARSFKGPILVGLGLFLAVLWLAALIVGPPSFQTDSGQSGTSASTSPRAGVTLASYGQLQDGISYADAVRILGAPGTEMSRTTLGGVTTVMYTWEGSGDIGANMNAMFQNDQLVSKAQFGLR